MASGPSTSPQELVKQADQFRLMGDYEKAISLLESFCENEPFFAPAKLSLGRAYFESGKAAQALTVLSEYVEFVPENILAHKILARIYLHQKDMGKAQDHVQIVLNIDQEDVVGKQLQEQIQKLDQDPAEGDDTVKTATPTLTPTMAELYYHQGHLKEARAVYEKLLTMDPHNLDFQEKIRMIDHESEHESEVPQATSAPVPTKDMPETSRSSSKKAVEVLEHMLQSIKERKRG